MRNDRLCLNLIYGLLLLTTVTTVCVGAVKGLFPWGSDGTFELIAGALTFGWIVIRRELPSGSQFPWLILVSLSLLAWAALVYYLNDLYPSALWRLGQIGLGISIGCAVYLTVNTVARALLLSTTIVAATLISGLFGICVLVQGEPFFSAWLAATNVSEATVDEILRTGRTAGASGNIIGFSYQLAVALPLAAGLLVLQPFPRFVSKWAWHILSVLAVSGLVVALLMNATRTAIGGVLVGLTAVLVVAVLYLDRSERWIAILKSMTVGVLVSITFISVAALSFNERIISLNNTDRAKLPLFRTAINYSRDNPFGTGTYAPEIHHVPSGMTLEPRLMEIVLTRTPHNQFLVVLVYYGVSGLVMLLAFYGVVFWSISGAFRTAVSRRDSRSIIMVISIAGAIAAYAVNSLFHNSGPFVGDWYHWIVIGLVFSVQSMVNSNGRLG